MRIPHSAVALAAGLCSAHARRKPNDKHSKRSKLRPSLRTMMRNAGPTAPRPTHKVYIQCRINPDNQRAQMRTALASQLIGRMTAPPPETVNVNVCQPMSGQVNTCIYPH